MDANKINEIASAFKIRASATLDICGGTIGLTDKQSARLQELMNRDSGIGKPLTDNMKQELIDLKSKEDNPELTEGAKTYCKKWLKEYLYHRRKDVKSKYIDKGNRQEEDGFTLMAIELGLGMVYKNTQYHSTEFTTGTDDLFVNGIVYDNKCSWDLDTFPMFEEEIPDDKYEWQINTYCDQRGVDNGMLVYTLIDADAETIEREIKWLTSPNDIYKRLSELVFTADKFNALCAELCPDATFTYFVEIAQSDRIKAFPIKKDPAKIATIQHRVPMCREYIKELLTKKYLK